MMKGFSPLYNLSLLRCTIANPKDIRKLGKLRDY